MSAPEGTPTNQVFVVGRTTYRQEGDSWWCTDERLPGWTGVADTQAECEALRREAMVLLPVQAELTAVHEKCATLMILRNVVAAAWALIDDHYRGSSTYASVHINDVDAIRAALAATEAIR